MPTNAIQYRQATLQDVPALARIRAAVRETEEYWQSRIAGYLDRTLHPQHAKKPRVVYLAHEGGIVVGFIAAHLTSRYDCDGELEWIDVIEQKRGLGIASELLRLLARWLLEHDAKRVCVDVVPENTIARKFYTQHGATDLNKHWMVWHDIAVVTTAKG